MLKLDIRGIISNHLDTLVDARTGRQSFGDYLVFFLVPALVGVFVAWVGLAFTDNAVAILISALSIFAGLLINVLVLLYTVRSVGPTDDERDRQELLIKEVNANLLFAILVALLAIVFLCVVPFLRETAVYVAVGCAVALTSNFVLTLIMSLKRLSVLLSLRFKPGVEPSPPTANHLN